MRIVIIGGHLSPALCVLENLPKEDTVLFIGRKHALEGDKAISLEQKTIEEKEIPFKAITTGRLQRRFTKHTIFSLLKISIGFFQSIKTLKDFKPDVVLSFGGYLSVPVSLASFFLGIPVVIHEQTLGAGLSNKIVSRFAKKICISWEESKKFFPKEKVVLTGNPIRKFKVQSSKFKVDEELPIVYITGGSLGSHPINVLIEECIEKLLEKYIVIHQTGDTKEFNDFQRLEKLKKGFSSRLSNRYALYKFIDPSKIGSIMQKASLVVSRSGINTITELIYFSKPALLIPLPHGQSNEQMENSLFFKKLGLGEVLDQNKTSSAELFNRIVNMVENLDNYKKNTKEIILKDASKNIIAVINSVVKKPHV